MNRKKHFLLILLALVLTFTMSFSLFACDRNTGDENEGVVDEKALVNNGTFAGVESETYPKVPTGWTGSAGSVSGSQATPSVQGEDLQSGVINVSDKIYKDNAKKWNLSKNSKPGKPNSASKDNNLLMINNLKNTSFRYTSTSVSLDKNSYYKVSVSVKTEIQEKDGKKIEPTAFIYVLGDAYAEFKNIKTDGQWKTFELYIETSINANKSITISLGNGWGDKTGTLSTGAVFFDEVIVEKLEKKDDEAFGKKTYDEKVSLDKSTDNNFATYSMIMPDSEFEYTSGNTQPLSPSKYRGYAGYSESGNNAPTSSSYVTHGVLDMSNADALKDMKLEDVKTAPNTLGTKMLFINNIKKTAYGYRSSVPFVIEAGKSYVFSVQIRTQNMMAANGATLRLVESSTDNNKSNQIANIDTNGEWQTATFTIDGNQLSTKEIYFELWLGEGGVIDESKWATGTVYIDGVKFGEATKAETAALAGGSLNAEVSYADDIDVHNNIITNGFIMGDGNNGWATKEFNEKTYNFYNDPTKVYHSVVKNNVEGKKIPLPADNIIITDNGANPVTLDTVLKMHLGTKTGYGFIINNGSNFNIEKNNYYKFSMWVKTDLDEKYDSMGLNINLMQKSKKADEDDKSIASFTNVNTRKVEVNNGYVKVTFYVEGSNTDNNELYLDIMLGSGSRFTPETHVEGDAYIALVEAEKIGHEDYVKASTSTYTKKNSLSTSTSSQAKIANGDFSDTDINATYDNYTKYQGKTDVTEDEVIKHIIKDGSFIVPTAPTSWSISNKSYLEALTTGIVESADQFANITNAELKANLTNLIDGVDGSALVLATKAKAEGKGYLTVPTSPETCGCTCEECKKNGLCTGNCSPKDGKECNCLHSKNAQGILPVGYTSQSLSLSANQYYMISVRVKAVEGKACISLTNTTETDYVIVDSQNSTGWQTVRFFVNTGLSSTSIKLELYLGAKGSGEIVTGAVAFDNATFLSDVKEDIYKDVKEDDYTRKIEYVTDTFNIDNPSEEGLSNAPSSWNGSVATNGSTKSEDLAKGVFDKNYTRNEWLKTTKKDGDKVEDILLDGGVYDYLVSANTSDNFLVINNVTPNGYSFTNSSDSKTLVKDAYYKISVDVLTYGLKADENAYISLKLNNVTYTFDKNDESDAAKKVLVNTSTYKDDVETLGKWTTYTFYVKTPENTTISNVTVTLGLGKASDNKDKKDENFVQGYAFFDNVVFKKLDVDTEFTEAVDGSLIKKIEATDEEMLKKPEEEKKEEPAKPHNDLLWVYITSGVIGGLIIIVVIGVVIKKYWSKISAFFTKKKGKTLSEYDKNHPNNNGEAAPEKKEKKSKKEFKD